MYETIIKGTVKKPVIIDLVVATIFLHKGTVEKIWNENSLVNWYTIIMKGTVEKNITVRL